MRIGSITPAVGSANSIVVDNYGNRYEAETKVTDNPSRYFFYKAAVTFDISSLSYPRTPSWMIFDEKLRTSKPLVGLGISTVGYGFIDWDEKNEKPIASGLILKADSIEELANKIKQHPENKGRMIPANLVEQVTRFNKFCDDKKDADFGRRPATLGKIEEGSVLCHAVGCRRSEYQGRLTGRRRQTSPCLGRYTDSSPLQRRRNRFRTEVRLSGRRKPDRMFSLRSSCR